MVEIESRIVAIVTALRATTTFIFNSREFAFNPSLNLAFAQTTLAIRLEPIFTFRVEEGDFQVKLAAVTVLGWGHRDKREVARRRIELLSVV